MVQSPRVYDNFSLENYLWPFNYQILCLWAPGGSFKLLIIPISQISLLGFLSPWAKTEPLAFHFTFLNLFSYLFHLTLPLHELELQVLAISSVFLIAMWYPLPWVLVSCILKSLSSITEPFILWSLSQNVLVILSSHLECKILVFLKMFFSSAHPVTKCYQFTVTIYLTPMPSFPFPAPFP